MKSLLLFVSYLFLTIQVNCQEFAPIGAKWTFETAEFQSMNGNSTYTSLRDTTIAGQTFRIVDKEVETCNINFPGFNYFRQSGDSIFWMHEYYPEPQLIFDFGAVKGDSWFVPHHDVPPFYSEFASQYELVVDSVYTTTFIPNIEVATFDVSLSIALLDSTSIFVSETRFFEHIGFEVALLPTHFDGICDYKLEAAFKCYSDSDLGEIKLEDIDCLSSSIEELDNIAFHIQPNPAQSSFKITDIELSDIDVEIYSTSGKMVRYEIYDDLVYIGDISSGIYFVSLINDNKRVIRKLVVNR